MRLDTALELSLYLSKETAIMPVTQGFGELVPIYKLMEKRDLGTVENQMKVTTLAAKTKEMSLCFCNFDSDYVQKSMLYLLQN